jgi:hypothetical protein
LFNYDNMAGPGLTFGFILATLLGAIFHLIFGGDARRLALFLLAGWLGFGLGQVLGLLFEINIFTVGSLRMLSAVTGTLVALTVARFMSSNRIRRRSTRKG